MQYTPLAVICLAITRCLAISNTSVTECGQEPSPTTTVRISVVSKRNQTGQWVTSFTSSNVEPTTKLDSNITLDLTQSVTECDGMRTVRIMGTMVGSPQGVPGISNEHISEKLLFHSTCGKNVAVLNGGRTLQKINLDDALNSVAFTNRPLRNNELFEVKLDKKHNKFSLSLGIGATTHSPTDIDYPNHINHIKVPSWAMYHAHLYQNGSLTVKSYGKDLNTLVVGDRVGVMRSDTGSLHYYVNGVDQGPAASNVPYPIYGLLELWHNAAMATIVDSS